MFNLNPFRVGLAGLSRTDARHLLPALAGLDPRQAELVAVADADAGRAQVHLAMLDTTAGRRAAFEAGHVVAPGFAPDAVSLHDDAEVMVEEDDLDAVVIAGTGRPAALAELALRRGRDVLLLAPPALADPEALLYLSGIVRGFGRTLWPVHPSGLLRPSPALVAAPELLGTIVGARATWNHAGALRPEAMDAAALLPLTAPFAALLDAGSIERTDVTVTGRGVERTVHVGWITDQGHRAEIEIRLGFALAPHDRAWITLHGTGGAQVDLPLVSPGVDIEPPSRTLRGVLFHPAQGPLTLPPPRTPAVGHRAAVTDWIDVARARRPEQAPVPTALVAARLAADLAEVLRQDG